MKKYIVVIATTLLFAGGFSAQSQKTQVKMPSFKTMPYDSASVPRERFVDFQHLLLEVSFAPEQGLVKGFVTHTFNPLRKQVDSFFVDAPGIQVSELKLDDQAVRYRQTAEEIWVYPSRTLSQGAQHTLSIRYEAKPRKGIYFIGWNDATGRARKQIWTQGQGIDNRYWIPMFDYMNDKITSEVKVLMPKPFKVLSNGVLLSSTEQGNNQLWHYKMSHPHAPYLIMLGIGDYGIETRKSASGVAMDLWYYPDQADRVEPTYRFSKEMFDFFEQEIGVPYPWEKYSQIPVQDFLYGAMENTTATVFGDFFYNDARGYLDRKYVGVNAHELAHQWFGDMVTAITPVHHWLQESFATHYNMIYEREALGLDYFDMARRNAQNSAFNASSRDLFPVAHSQAGSTRWYPKGAVVLEMLKYVIGREDYNRAVKYYLERNAYGNVDSHDLLRAIHATTGQSLDWFWEQWVYRGGEPIYAVRSLQNAQSVMFNVVQKQMQEPAVSVFKMPFVFEVWYTDGTVTRKKVWIENKETNVEIQFTPGKKVAYWLFDPNNEVMKAVDFPKSTEMLIAQANSASHMLDRLDAVLSLGNLPLTEVRKELQTIFRKEKSVYVRKAILEILSPDKDKSSRKLFAEALAAPSWEIRQAALQNLDTLTKEFVKPVENLLSDSSYVTIEAALDKLCSLGPVESYLAKTKGVVGNNAHNVQITWLKYAIRNGQKNYVDTLIDLCSNAFEFNTRRAAFALAKDLVVINTKLIDHAWDAALNPNSRLSNGGLGVLIWAYGLSDWKAAVEAKLATLGNSDWEQVLKDRITKPKK